MATPQNRIARKTALRLAEVIDQRLPEQVEQLLAARDTHEWASGKRFGANQAVLTTIAGYLIGATNLAWGLCVDPWVERHRPRAGTPESELFAAFLAAQIRGRLGTPRGIPGYICDEVLTASIGETIDEVERPTGLFRRPSTRPPPAL